MGGVLTDEINCSVGGCLGSSWSTHYPSNKGAIRQFGSYSYFALLQLHRVRSHIYIYIPYVLDITQEKVSLCDIKIWNREK